MAADTLKTADRFHAELVDLLVARGTVRTGPVEAALRAVPRHAFVPGAALESAYALDDAVVTKRGQDGAALSSASAPGVVAAMLEQLDVHPGDRILEIGAGTGYNAALLAELTGPAGHVVTVDIDADVVDGARTALTATGYGQVEVLCADGADGHAPAGPYDRIIVTAGAWDLPPAWWQQLTPDGRLVVPLRIIGGTTRSVAFDRDGGDHLVSQSMMTCGFLAMRGIGAQPEPSLTLGDGVQLLLGDGRTAPPGPLAHALTQPALRTWTGITIRSGAPFQDLDLWLATTGSGFCRIIAQPDAVASDLAEPAFRWGGAAVTNESDSFAYLTIRPAEPADDTGTRYELGVRAHGPHRDDLAAALTEQIHRWDSDHRATTPRIDAYLKPIHRGPGQVESRRIESHQIGSDTAAAIDKPHVLLTVTWRAR
ncbi:methyltransferase, FxLD system [Microbispora cellulosiformans]|uniref:Protein-L-isoaspartate O-methyltransferase n=1 Tax=Microbispora cellulosiformans TaxID=2614688 RepID=A0A5J5K767_9ACTN|nr:methyltransferase, FxLD system [Microbispora cellulosiformans]KAA9379638.1 methyltransferase, FxLD system [Microbispora cellulosiformans]